MLKCSILATSTFNNNIFFKRCSCPFYKTNIFKCSITCFAGNETVNSDEKDLQTT